MKRKNKNNLLSIGICITLTLLLCSCSIEKYLHHLDLSQYSDHGEMVNGLMWVEKENDDWKNGKTKYNAFIDETGKVVSQWYKISEEEKIGDLDINSKRFRYDFLDGFILIRIARPFQKPEVIILNNAGKEIVKNLNFYFVSEGPNKSYILEYSIIDDYFFFKECRFQIDEKHKHDDIEFNLCCVDEAGEIIRFDGSVFTKHEESTYRQAGFSKNDLAQIEHKQQRFFMKSNGMAWIFDENGQCIFDFYDKVKDFVPESVDYDQNDNIECIFKGKDGNKYRCVIDFDANFIENPRKI